MALLGGAAALPLAARAQQPGKMPDHRLPGRGDARLGLGRMGRSFRAAAARARLDRGPHRRDRVSLGGGTQPSATPRSRPSSSASRSTSSSRRAAPVTAAKQATSIIPIVFAAGERPGRQRPGRKSRAPGRQRHRPVDSAARPCRQAARTLARGRPRPAPVGDPGQCRLSCSPCWRCGEVQAAARTLGLEVATLEIRRRGGYRACLRGAQGPRGRALCLLATRSLTTSRDPHQHAWRMAARLPTISGSGRTSKPAA